MFDKGSSLQKIKKGDKVFYIPDGDFGIVTEVENTEGLGDMYEIQHFTPKGKLSCCSTFLIPRENLIYPIPKNLKLIPRSKEFYLEALEFKTTILNAFLKLENESKQH